MRVFGVVFLALVAGCGEESKDSGSPTEPSPPSTDTEVTEPVHSPPVTTPPSSSGGTGTPVGPTSDTSVSIITPTGNTGVVDTSATTTGSTGLVESGTSTTVLPQHTGDTSTTVVETAVTGTASTGETGVGTATTGETGVITIVGPTSTTGDTSVSSATGGTGAVDTSTTSTTGGTGVISLCADDAVGNSLLTATLAELENSGVVTSVSGDFYRATVEPGEQLVVSAIGLDGIPLVTVVNADGEELVGLVYANHQATAVEVFVAVSAGPGYECVSYALSLSYEPAGCDEGSTGNTFFDAPHVLPGAQSGVVGNFDDFYKYTVQPGEELSISNITGQDLFILDENGVKLNYDPKHWWEPPSVVNYIQTPMDVFLQVSPYYTGLYEDICQSYEFEATITPGVYAYCSDDGKSFTPNTAEELTGPVSSTFASHNNHFYHITVPPGDRLNVFTGASFVSIDDVDGDRLGLEDYENYTSEPVEAYIDVSGLGTCQNYTLNYSFDVGVVTPCEEDAVGNTLEEATAGLEGVNSGVLGAGGDDFFVYTVLPGDELSVEFNSTFLGHRLEIEGDAMNFHSYPVEVIVRVYSVWTPYCEPYEFTATTAAGVVSVCYDDAIGHSLDTASEVAVGVSSAVVAQGDADYYRYTLAPGDNLTATVTGDVEIEWVSEDDHGHYLGSLGYGNSTTDFVDLYLRVESKGECSPYDLDVQVVAGGEEICALDGVGTSVETATETTPGTVSGTLLKDQEAYYRLVIPSGAKFSAITPSGVTVYSYLYHEVTDSLWSSGSSYSNATLDEQVLYVKVIGSTYHCTDYELEFVVDEDVVSVCHDDPYEYNGESVYAAVLVPGVYNLVGNDTDYYQVALEPGQTLDVTTTWNDRYHMGLGFKRHGETLTLGTFGGWSPAKRVYTNDTGATEVIDVSVSSYESCKDYTLIVEVY